MVVVAVLLSAVPILPFRLKSRAPVLRLSDVLRLALTGMFSFFALDAGVNSRVALRRVACICICMKERERERERERARERERE